MVEQKCHETWLKRIVWNSSPPWILWSRRWRPPGNLSMSTVWVNSIQVCLGSTYVHTERYTQTHRHIHRKTKTNTDICIQVIIMLQGSRKLHLATCWTLQLTTTLKPECWPAAILTSSMNRLDWWPGARFSKKKILRKTYEKVWLMKNLGWACDYQKILWKT